jgi:hypothetical protein
MEICTLRSTTIREVTKSLKPRRNHLALMEMRMIMTLPTDVVVVLGHSTQITGLTRMRAFAALVVFAVAAPEPQQMGRRCVQEQRKGNPCSEVVFASTPYFRPNVSHTDEW